MNTRVYGQPAPPAAKPFKFEPARALVAAAQVLLPFAVMAAILLFTR